PAGSGNTIPQPAVPVQILKYEVQSGDKRPSSRHRHQSRSYALAVLYAKSADILLRCVPHATGLLYWTAQQKTAGYADIGYSRYKAALSPDTGYITTSSRYDARKSGRVQKPQRP